MADITQYNQGEVDDSGKVNWRVGEGGVAPGSQSIYKSSSVPLTELGNRKVVGDRVFRYAKAGGAIAVGEVHQQQNVEAKHIAVTLGGAAVVGGKTLTIFASTAIAANQFVEGTIHCESGTGQGHMYRIQAHGAISSGATGTISLYDSIISTMPVTDLVTLLPNMYLNVIQQTGTAQAPAGVSPIAATTSDYFWMQTWGPTVIKNSAGGPTIGTPALIGLTGAVQAYAASTNRADVSIGYAMYTATASDYGMVFLTIAP